MRFCPGAAGGAEWNSPAYDPKTNLVLIGEVDWCDTVTPKDVSQLRRVERGQPWAGMATWNPFWMFGKFGPTAGSWAGWVYAVDADSGDWKWRLKSNYPIVGAMTPTAGGVVFFGDIGGNFYATGQKLWAQDLDGGFIAVLILRRNCHPSDQFSSTPSASTGRFVAKLANATIECAPSREV